MLEVIAALLTLSMLSDSGVLRSKMLLENALNQQVGQRSGSRIWRFYVVFRRSFGDDWVYFIRRIKDRDPGIDARTIDQIIEAINEGPNSEIGVKAHVSARDFVVAAANQLEDELREEMFSAPRDWREELNFNVSVLHSLITPGDSLDGLVYTDRDIYYQAAEITIEVRESNIIDLQNRSVDEWFKRRMYALYGADEPPDIFELALTAGDFHLIGWVTTEGTREPYLLDPECTMIEAYDLLDEPIEDKELMYRLIYDELRQRDRSWKVR